MGKLLTEIELIVKSKEKLVTQIFVLANTLF